MSHTLAVPATGTKPPDRILRFHRSERFLHWAIAVPFMVCYTTALILVVVYNPAPLRPFRAVFSWIHRVSGVCLIVLPLLVLVRNRADYRVHLDNIRQGWVWTFDDVKWLMLSGLAAISSKVKLPDQGKFNAAEKLNFMTVMSTYPMFIVTGALIWLPGVAIYSWLGHFAMAALVTPLLVGHIFMATTNPSTRVGLSGMVSGYVDRTWASHHYSRWYRETFPSKVPDPPLAEIPASVCCSGCGACNVMTAWNGELRELLEADPLYCPDCRTRMDGMTVTLPQGVTAILHELDDAAGAGASEVPNLRLEIEYAAAFDGKPGSN